jgi:hypothetical protein
MAAVHPGLTGLLIGCSAVTGILALLNLVQYRQRRASTLPPFPYNDSTLHDFELLSAAGGLLLFAAFVALVAGLYELQTLQAALPVPLIVFTAILSLLLYRWQRRL